MNDDLIWVHNLINIETISQHVDVYDFTIILTFDKDFQIRLSPALKDI